MHPKITSILVVTAALVLTAACEQKVKTDSKNAIAPVESEEAFVIAPRLVNKAGAFELLAIIEGPDATEQFLKNLQLVKAQRAAIKQFKEQKEQTDEVKKKTEEVQKKLDENIGIMLKLYGYNADKEHMFLPARSALVKVTEGKKELIKRIDSPAVHLNLQAMRGKYAELTKKDGGNPAEAQTLTKKLLEEFNYDVKLTYEIDILKGALYRKVD